MRVIRVGPDGRYAASLSAGTYEINGRSPLYGDGYYECNAEKRVAITARTTAVADVYCQYV